MIEENLNNDALAKMITDGDADIQERGSALRMMKTGMAVKLTAGLDSMLNQLTEQSKLLNTCIGKYNEMIMSAIEADTVSIEELRDFIDSTQSKQVQILELYRRVLQGKDLFDSQTFSDDEKMVLKIFKSFKSKEDREKFVNIIRENYIRN